MTTTGACILADCFQILVISMSLIGYQSDLVCDSAKVRRMTLDHLGASPEI